MTPIEPTEAGNLIETLKQDLEFFLSPQLQHDLLLWKLIFIGISLLFIFFIILILRKDKYDYFQAAIMADMKDRMTYKDLGAKKIQKSWAKIKKRLEKPSDAHWKLALIEAEDFLDKVLIRMGYGGDSLTERLSRVSENDVSNLESLKNAHGSCEDIMKDPDAKLDQQTAIDKIAVFEKSLKDLSVL